MMIINPDGGWILQEDGKRRDHVGLRFTDEGVPFIDHILDMGGFETRFLHYFVLPNEVADYMAGKEHEWLIFNEHCQWMEGLPCLST
jgi:hypothetical protein